MGHLPLTWQKKKKKETTFSFNPFEIHDLAKDLHSTWMFCIHGFQIPSTIIFPQQRVEPDSYQYIKVTGSTVVKLYF